MSVSPAITPTQQQNPPPHDDRMRCGTLTYTKAGLFALFGWMLWGDFCFTLMSNIWANIIPLVMRAEGAPNTVVALVMTTIPSAMNFVLNPIISTFSDRYRGKRGRRIPFLLYSAPFISFFLILLGFSQEIGGFLYGLLAHLSPGLTQSAVTVVLIGLLVVCFMFFDLFVATVFYYLFNDVVPQAFIGRFLGLFRVVGGLAGALFNFFLFKYATSHTSTIFFGGAILYLVAFLLLGFHVKEGEYPPPEAMSKKKGFFLDIIKTYFRECFSHRIFRRVFAYSALSSVSGSINVFLIFMAISIGLTLDEVGKVAAVVGIVSMLLSYPMGTMVDHIHPLRVKLIVQMLFCVVTLMKCVFLFYDFPRDVAFWIYAALAGIAIPLQAANAAAGMPMVMRLFPHERFGQFCAANAMCGAFGAVIGGLLGGVFLDVLKRVFSDRGDYYYRFVPAWSLVFMLMASIMCYLVYREWQKLGGDKNYQSPIEDKFAGFHGSESSS